MLKGTAAGVAGLSAIGGIASAGYLLAQQNSQHGAHAAAPPTNVEPAQTILNIAATAEELGVVFYTQILNHVDYYDLSQAAFLDLKAALVEEQLHLLFLLQNGAKPLTHTFSFPFGRYTFRDFEFFIRTQQLLEAAFTAAYLAAVREFALLGRPDLSLIAAQIATVESEHRALGRAIGGLRPANNQAFTPALFQTVGQAAVALQRGGFLTPTRGNSFRFEPVSTNFNGVIARTPSPITTTAPMTTPPATPSMTPSGTSPTTPTGTPPTSPHF